ncbi:putative nicotianamine synthase [Diplogelasinospora grovesii]|uniref:Nicotianamine synthase n=1 Tax=Diplogelasinospora grovesii TaxID=303347 RepID=A0AAN6N755_9PEZI|nr:putative nicotianamine synthase [Diplogelasinospora grovesii]
MSSLIAWLGLGRRANLAKCLCDSDSGDSITIVEKAEVIRSQVEDAKSQTAQKLVQSIIATHMELLELPHFRPGKTIDELLGNLVSLCCQIHDQEIVRQVHENAGMQAILPSLRQICAEAESCLEAHWADRIVNGGVGSSPDDVFERLKSFPYYENYVDLTRLELCAMYSVTNSHPHKVAFIGSGPLPLTSLCMLDELKNSPMSLKGLSHCSDRIQPVILNMDYDEVAIAASLSLSLKLGARGQGMEFVCAEAGSDHQSLSEFDVVYVAALVGMSQADKEDILVKVANKMKRGALVVIRSSWGLRTCLYPEVDMTTDRLLQRLEPCVVVHPYGQVVNSVIVARVKP